MKAIKLAVCAAGPLILPCASFADTSSVQLYGAFLPFLENARISGATAPGLSPASGGASQVPAAAYTGSNAASRNRMTSGTSNIGFRGSEELGGGLNAIFQVESGFALDGNSGPPGLFANRNSNVGLTGVWGTAFAGIWDTPYKWTTFHIAPLRGFNAFDYDIILENPGFNVPGTTTQSGRTNAKPDAAFSRRQGNSIQYWTPELSGFSARIGYSVNEGKANVAGNSISPDLWSMAMSYDGDSLTLRYAYERHNDYFGLAQLGGSPGATSTNTSSKDEGNKVTAIYRLGAARLTGVYERLKYQASDSVPGAVTRYRRDAWFLGAQHRLGNHNVWAHYGKGDKGSCERVAGATCVTSGLGARQWTLGYGYSLSKRTDLFAAFYSIDNNQSASYGGILPVTPVPAPGADTRGLGLGMVHLF